MIHNDKIISALDFAEDCIKLVTANKEDFLKIKEYYRENKICVESFYCSREDTPEYILSKSYEYFRFGCHQENISFYKDFDGKKALIKEKTFINYNANKLFTCKGTINGESIYLSNSAYTVLLLTKENWNYNALKNDSFMLKCYHQLVEYILDTLHTTTVPPLKETMLNSYIDTLFPPSDYANSNFSLNKKQALIYLFDKTRTA